MPIKDSARKAMRNSAKKRVFNLARVREMRSLVKEVRELVKDKKKKEAETLMPKTYKALDKAVKTGVIKKNNASRMKSRLTQAIKKIS